MYQKLKKIFFENDDDSIEPKLHEIIKKLDDAHNHPANDWKIHTKALSTSEKKKVAAYFTGARESYFKSGSHADEEIRQKIEERRYLHWKSEQNKNVTPW